jgi:hypothetical protein
MNMNDKQEAINNYMEQNRKKFGATRYEVTFVIEEQDEQMLETLLNLIEENLYTAHPLLFKQEMNMRYIECEE